MIDEASREPARDPQDLERLLIARQWVGDIDGMAALFEPHAVVDSGEGRLIRAGTPSGRASRRSPQRVESLLPEIRVGPLSTGTLALTSTRFPDGSVTAEVARRQGDGTWLWVIDRFSIA